MKSWQTLVARLIAITGIWLVVGTSFIVVHHCIDGELIPHWIAEKGAACGGHTTHHQEEGFNPLACHDDYLPAFQRIANVLSISQDLKAVLSSVAQQLYHTPFGSLRALLSSVRGAALAAPYGAGSESVLIGGGVRLCVFLCCLLR